jgi:hypothetical protein
MFILTVKDSFSGKALTHSLAERSSAHTEGLSQREKASRNNTLKVNGNESKQDERGLEERSERRE